MNNGVKVWDLPTRLFHWSLVCLLVGLWWTADEGEMERHMILAYCLGTLLVFRIIWGIVGSQTARFSHFVTTPGRVMSYARNLPKDGIQPHFGHNPLGGYMVVALLLSLVVQFATGLFATDEVFVEGPLYAYVSSETADWMTWLHKKNFDLLLVLIVLHVGAVLLHMVKGDALLGAMFTGKRNDLGDEVGHFRPLWLALVLFGVIGGLTGYFFIWPVYSNML